MQLFYGLNPCWLRLNRILCQEMCRLPYEPALLTDWPCWRGLPQRCWRRRSPFCCLLCHNASGQGSCVAPVLQLRLMAQGLGMSGHVEAAA